MGSPLKHILDTKVSALSDTGQPWWKGASIYQIYPRSFKDSTGNGVGDLPGITEKLDHVADLGVDAIWLSPFFKSPMADYGYDVSDFCDVDPVFGSLRDFDALVARAHNLGLKVIIDQVYSHSSDQHPWFGQSRSSRDNPKADWYVWADPKPDGSPPNNWQSVFAGSAWQWDARRGQYYLHNFLAEQPDLNLHNLEVQEAIFNVAQFWLDRGVDGFRLDALNFGFHNRELTDNPPATRFKRPPRRPHDFQVHMHNMSQPEAYPFVEKIRNILEEYSAAFTVAEVGGPFPLAEMKAFTQGSNRLNSAYAFDYLYADKLTAELVRETLSDWPGNPDEGWPSWAFSNHDAPRALTRWRDDCAPETYAKLLFLLMTSLRGNIFIYQGEELGLSQAELAFADLKDPEAIANWPHTLGRDGARTPMPWTANDENAGFSSVRPWLPIDPKHKNQSASLQNTDQGSVLSFYKKALKIRQLSDTLKSGDTETIADNLDLLIIRRTNNDQVITGIFNLTANTQSLNKPKYGLGDILISTDNFELSNGNVPPYSGALIC